MSTTQTTDTARVSVRPGVPRQRGVSVRPPRRVVLAEIRRAAFYGTLEALGLAALLFGVAVAVGWWIGS